jgi:hypothetical protein
VVIIAVVSVLTGVMREYIPQDKLQKQLTKHEKFGSFILKALQEVILEENGVSLAITTECRGVCGKVFKAVGVAVPPTIRVLE